MLMVRLSHRFRRFGMVTFAVGAILCINSVFSPLGGHEAQKCKDEVLLLREKKSELTAKAQGHQQFVKKYGSDLNGWLVDTSCLLRKQEKKEPVVIYGVGAGEDISWDIEMVKEFGAEVFVFDPTDKANHYMTRIIQQNEHDNKLHFYPEGMSSDEGLMTLALPSDPTHVSMREVHLADEQMKEKLVTAKVNTLQNWMKIHNHHYLDVLKIDIEGAEYDVLDALVKDNFLPFTQLLVEYHVRFLQEEEKFRHAQIKRSLEAAGFFELWSQNNDQEVGYLKLVDVESCEKTSGETLFSKL